MFVTPGGSIDYVKLPSIRKVGQGRWEPAALHVEPEEISAQRAAITKAAALHFRPDVVVVDYLPVGPNGELLPALRGLREQDRQTQFVLGLRDVLDAPHVTVRQWRDGGVYDALDDLYDCIFVYGWPDVFDTVRAYRLPADKVRYCGYVCASHSTADPAELRRALGLGDGRLVLAMAGGGADGYALLHTFIQAIRSLGRPDFDSLVVSGPLMDPEQHEALVSEADGWPVRVVSSIDDSLAHIAAADVVVSMAGYNALVELVACDRWGIVVPRSGPSAEQSIRARLFAERGLVSAISPDQLTPERLASAVVGALRQRPVPRRGQRPDLGGERRAAEHILELIGQPAARRPPKGVLASRNGSRETSRTVA